MAITNAIRDSLDKMCISAKNALIGTIIQGLQNSVDTLETESSSEAKGTYTMDGDDQTAGSTTIATGITTINAFTVQVYRSNLLVADYDVQATGGDLTVATNGTDYVVTTGDVVNYIVY